MQQKRQKVDVFEEDHDQKGLVDRRVVAQDVLVGLVELVDQDGFLHSLRRNQVEVVQVLVFFWVIFFH